MNIGQSLRFFASELAECSEDPMPEARLLIQKATGLTRPVLLSHPERELTAAEMDQLFVMIERRKSGEPLPYILGEWEFFGHSFHVDPSVLIPRPETEMLVEEADIWLRAHPSIRSGFDIGTGSGCIAVSLLLDHPELRMTAVDIRADTLRTACANAERHGVRSRFFPVRANLCSSFSGKFCLVCANLPYIPTETCEVIEPARFEPMTALDGGEDGFDLYRLLFQQISHKMNEESLILCEIEYRQQDLAMQTAEAFFPGWDIRVLKDLAGLPRLLRICSAENRLN